jgi:hypothetical protein
MLALDDPSKITPKADSFVCAERAENQYQARETETKMENWEVPPPP